MEREKSDSDQCTDYLAHISLTAEADEIPFIEMFSMYLVQVPANRRASDSNGSNGSNREE